MPDQIYEELRDLLDRHPAGCPPAPEIYEILGILFTEEEARVAVGLNFRPSSVEDIAARAGVDTEEAGKRLESLADKAVVFAREKDGEWGYALLPIMPGVFEFPLMKGVHDETVEKLIPLWKSYMPRLAESLGAPSTAIVRAIPIQEQVENEQGILTYEMLYDMIDRAKAVGVAHCACREMEQLCDAPREACMLFDDTCTFLVERGYGRYLTKEEMKDKLRDFDEAGLVHQVNNAQDRLGLICNCCSCCCGLLRLHSKSGSSNVIASSGFVPVNDPDSCVGCGVCADERCPMEAIEITGDVVVVDLERCLGCGLCATGCPNQAMRMERCEERIEPPENTAAMGISILQATGKLERFMERL
jgi:H+/Na+-translocating ferredoxin:NAD+ oxidoreductase subunit B